MIPSLHQPPATMTVRTKVLHTTTTLLLQRVRCRHWCRTNPWAWNCKCMMLWHWKCLPDNVHGHRHRVNPPCCRCICSLQSNAAVPVCSPNANSFLLPTTQVQMKLVCDCIRMQCLSLNNKICWMWHTNWRCRQWTSRCKCPRDRVFHMPWH